jgi:3-hydroxybutyryl-CoA dehydratase
MDWIPAKVRRAISGKRETDRMAGAAGAEPSAEPAPEPASYTFEDLQIGMTASYTRVVQPEDIAAFAALSGDTNPVHLDEEYAAGTRFKVRIVHGLLTASYISTVLGTKLPGAGAIYLSQTLNFRAPVYHGDTVTALVEVTEMIEEKSRIVLACTCHVGERLVLDGEARLMVPRREDQS